MGHALNGRVVQLELSGSPDGLLDTFVIPEATDSICDVPREVLSLDLTGERHDDGPSGVVAGIEGDVEDGHGFEDGAHGLDGVGVDDLLVGLSLLVVPALVVDEFHLFEDGGLPARRG